MSLEEFASRGLKAQVAVDELSRINLSTDVHWLRSLMSSRDAQLTVRSAAERRLKLLARERKKL